MTHRLGSVGWYLESKKNRLHLVSAELPLRPGGTAEQGYQRWAFTLQAPPGPTTATAALSEACAVFDAVMANTWRWPDPDSTPLQFGRPNGFDRTLHSCGLQSKARERTGCSYLEKEYELENKRHL
jgi:hypothetical protein